MWIDTGENRLLWTDRSDTRGTGCIAYVGGTLHIRRCSSGAVFFSGCPLGCVFCQNHSIAAGRLGKTIATERLAEIFLELQDQKAWNINLVTAGHFAPQVVRALELAKGQGLKLPIVYNTSGYEKVETLRMFEGLVDIYLPDFKYLSAELADAYSHAADYPQVAKLALQEMVRQVGSAQFEIVSGENSGRVTDELLTDVDYGDGELERMLQGVVVRHLVLPGYVEESKNVIRYLYETYGNQIYISIMNQYTPMSGIEVQYPELGRKITLREYDEVWIMQLKAVWKMDLFRRGRQRKKVLYRNLILLECSWFG